MTVVKAERKLPVSVQKQHYEEPIYPSWLRGVLKTEGCDRANEYDIMAATRMSLNKELEAMSVLVPVH